MTEVQTAALQRIIRREEAGNVQMSEGSVAGCFGVGFTAGVHPSCDRYVVTDGGVAVVLGDMPKELPEVMRLDKLYRILEGRINARSYIFALSVTDAHLSKWKEMSKRWTDEGKYDAEAVPVEITTSEDNRIVGFYNPILLVDAVEAVGSDAVIYIGKYEKCNPFHSLLIYPREWTENCKLPISYVSPLMI